MKKYKKRYLNVLSVNSLILILAIVFLTIGFDIQKKYDFMGQLITEVFIILLPALFIAKTGNIRKVLRVHKISFKNIFLTVLIVILAYPIILLLNGIFMSLISSFMDFTNSSRDLIDMDPNIYNYIIFFCIVPAICEEVLFRATVINAYDIYGTKFAIGMSALVFALFHFDIQNFVAPLLLGILFGNILKLTDSLYAAIIAHFTNNIIAVIFSRYINERFSKMLWQTEMARQIGSLQLFIVIILIVLSILCSLILRLLFKHLKKEQMREERNITAYREVEGIDIFNFVPILALVILYIIYYSIVFKWNWRILWKKLKKQQI